MCIQKAQNQRRAFPQTMPDEHPRTPSTPYPPPPRLRSFGAALVMLCSFPPSWSSRPYGGSSMNRVLFSTHSSCTRYSLVSFEGSTLASVLHPAALRPSSLSSFVFSASFPPFFPFSIPPPCLASSLLPFFPPVNLSYPLDPGGSGRVAKPAAGTPFSFYSSMRCPRVSYNVSTTA